MFLGSKHVPRFLHIVTLWESLLRLSQYSSLNITFQCWCLKLQFKQARFFADVRGNANCWSSDIQASMTESSVNSLSRNSYSCGDCECQIQFSGSTALLMLRTYFQILVLVKDCDSWSTWCWSSDNISHTLKPLLQSWDHRLVHVQNSRHFGLWSSGFQHTNNSSYHKLIQLASVPSLILFDRNNVSRQISCMKFVRTAYTAWTGL